MGKKGTKKRMSSTGRITMYNPMDEPVLTRKYCYLSQRNYFIETWKRYYGKAFAKMYYQIAPRLDDVRVDEIILP